MTESSPAYQEFLEELADAKRCELADEPEDNGPLPWVRLIRFVPDCREIKIDRQSRSITVDPDVSIWNIIKAIRYAQEKERGAA